MRGAVQLQLGGRVWCARLRWVGRREGGGGGRKGGALTQVAKVFDRLVQDGVHCGVLVDGSRQQLRQRK